MALFRDPELYDWGHARVYCTALINGYSWSRQAYIVTTSLVTKFPLWIKLLKYIYFVLLNACKDIGLAANTGKTKQMEMFYFI